MSVDEREVKDYVRTLMEYVIDGMDDTTRSAALNRLADEVARRARLEDM